MTLNELIVRDNNSFGVIRLVAASAVIFGHSFELTTGNFSDVPLNGSDGSFQRIEIPNIARISVRLFDLIA